MRQGRGWLLVGLLALAISLSGCNLTCVSCAQQRALVLGSASFDLCLSEFPEAGEELSECTVVELEFVVVDSID